MDPLGRVGFALALKKRRSIFTKSPKPSTKSGVPRSRPKISDISKTVPQLLLYGLFSKSWAPCGYRAIFRGTRIGP